MKEKIEYNRSDLHGIMKNIPFILCLAASMLVMACASIGNLLSDATEIPVDITSETPPDWTTMPKPSAIEPTISPQPSATEPSTSHPTPDLNNVCVLFPEGSSIWLKEANHPPIEIAGSDYETSNAACPPETLLPQVEVNVADIGEPEKLEMRNLIPHLCRQHPTQAEVWFNTEQPLVYGKHYQGDLWRFKVEEGSVEQILQDEQGGQFFNFSPDGKYLVMASSQNLRIMRSDGSELRQLFDFPELSICSEVNVWVTPWWYPDSSGIILNVHPECLNEPASWPFGLWWVPLMGEAVSIDPFAPEISSHSLMDPSTQRRELDSERNVFLENNTLYLSQEGYQPIELMTLENPDEGYFAFLCPTRE